MLWFLSLAAAQGFCVDRYHDAAVGVMIGRMISRVTLRPAVQFSGGRLPCRAEVTALHHQAHGECYIAKSVKTEVLCEPVFVEGMV